MKKLFLPWLALLLFFSLGLAYSGGVSQNQQFNSVGVGTAASGTAGSLITTANGQIGGDLIVGSAGAGNKISLVDPGGTAHSFSAIDGAGNLNLGLGVTNKGVWAPGTNFTSTDGTGVDWELTRNVLATGNPGIQFGTANIAADVGISRTAANTLNVIATGGINFNGSKKGLPFASGTLSVTDSAAVGCVDAAVAVTGVTTTMAVVVSPQGAPAGAGSGNITWSGYPTAGNVNIRVCTIAAVTAAATTYNYVVYN